MPVSFSKSALWARSACDTGLLLARKVTVLPWNFFQSKSAPCAADATAPAARSEKVTRASAALAVIAVLPYRRRFCLGPDVIENGFILGRRSSLSRQPKEWLL